MSNHHTICCLDCDADGYAEMESIHDVNWEHEGFVWVLKNRQALVDLNNQDERPVTVEIDIRVVGISMDIAFLDRHNDHRLVGAKT